MGATTPEQRRVKKARRVARELGQPGTQTTAVRAQQHLIGLRSGGETFASLHRRTGMSEAGLVDLVHGRRKKIFITTEARILALRPIKSTEAVRAGAQVSPLGARRRLQALVAEGFVRKWMSLETGIAENNLTFMMTGQVKYLLESTEARVKELYGKYAGTDPLALGLSEVAVRRQQAKGKRANWAGSIYWDDDSLDDPDGFPDWTGLCGSERGNRAHRSEGSEICPPCTKAHTEYNQANKARAREVAAGAPKMATGVKAGTGSGRWSDHVLILQVRQDFESWMDYADMAEKYQSSIHHLKKVATADGLWTHDSIHNSPNFWNPGKVVDS